MIESTSSRIVDIAARPHEVAMRVSFKHSSKDRSTTESILTSVTLATGHVGRGEGTPRSYVTGETLDTAAAFIAELSDAFIGSVHDVDSLRDFTDAHRAVIDENPAAFASLELAFLDAHGQHLDTPLEALLGVQLQPQFRYSAVIGDSAGRKLALICAAYRMNAMRHLKLKVSNDLDREAAKAKIIQRVLRPKSLRVDANNLWTSPAEAIENIEAIQDLHGTTLSGIEEPLAGDASTLGALAEIAEAVGVPIILDESYTSIDIFDDLAAAPRHWIINARVSRLGGVTRALAVIERAHETGVRIIVGAHVGETSILTRAALPVASAAAQRNLLLHQEGAFGTLLLSSDVSSPSLRFGRGGVLKTARHELGSRPGLGLA